jgi:phosphoglycolate phosphatase-like HAD superfamily hydrolase
MHRLTVAVLRGLGVESCFDMILGGDSAPQKKPDPSLLQRALIGFAVPAERALMVGDGDIDIEAGKRAGVVTCGVTYGLGRKQDIIAAAPDFIIDSLSELVRYIY